MFSYINNCILSINWDWNHNKCSSNDETNEQRNLFAELFDNNGYLQANNFPTSFFWRNEVRVNFNSEWQIHLRRKASV